jgi:RNA ligase (TIGR02306 family)
MSELTVPLIKIDRIEPHPNADRMELVFVDGYQVCVQCNTFIPGDKAVYIPVDSIVNGELEALIFGANSKVKLHKHRVKCIKLRGAMSEGLLIPWDCACQYLDTYNFKQVKVILSARVGDNLMDVLNITKYQPPVKVPRAMAGAKQSPKRHCHPAFSKYTDIGHLKKYWNAFKEGENVIVTEKIHGTNFRCGWVPFIPRTFFQKLKNIFTRSKTYEFVYGSHNVQLMDGGQKKKDAFADNVYLRVVNNNKLKQKIPMGQLWYGEIFGDGIQKGYEYSRINGRVDVMFMDIKDVILNEYFDFHAMVEHVEAAGECAVPHWCTTFNREHIIEHLNDPERISYVDGKTKPIEGYVIRRDRSEKFYGGRLILKLLSDAYLLRKDNTDWH